MPTSHKHTITAAERAMSEALDTYLGATAADKKDLRALLAHALANVTALEGRNSQAEAWLGDQGIGYKDEALTALYLKTLKNTLPTDVFQDLASYQYVQLNDVLDAAWGSYQEAKKADDAKALPALRETLAEAMAQVSINRPKDSKAEIYAQANDIVHEDPKLHALYFKKVKAGLSRTELKTLPSFSAEAVRKSPPKDGSAAFDITDAGARARALLDEYAAHLDKGQEGTQTLDALLAAATEEAVARRNDPHAKTLQKLLATDEAYADPKFHTLKFRLEDRVRPAIEKAELKASGVLDIPDAGERAHALLEMYEDNVNHKVQNLTVAHELTKAAVQEQILDCGMPDSDTVFQRLQGAAAYAKPDYHDLRVSIDEELREFAFKSRQRGGNPVKHINAAGAVTDGRATQAATSRVVG